MKVYIVMSDPDLTKSSYPVPWKAYLNPEDAERELDRIDHEWDYIKEVEVVMSKLRTKYFVLKPEGKDLAAVASRSAMETYAGIIRVADPEFSKEIEDWVIECRGRAQIGDE